MLVSILPQFGMIWFGFPTFDVTEIHHLEKVSDSVSMAAPCEINCVLQPQGNGGWDAEMERGQLANSEGLPYGTLEVLRMLYTLRKCPRLLSGIDCNWVQCCGSWWHGLWVVGGENCLNVLGMVVTSASDVLSGLCSWRWCEILGEGQHCMAEWCHQPTPCCWFPTSSVVLTSFSRFFFPFHVTRGKQREIKLTCPQ